MFKNYILYSVLFLSGCGVLQGTTSEQVSDDVDEIAVINDLYSPFVIKDLGKLFEHGDSIAPVRLQFQSLKLTKDPKSSSFVVNKYYTILNSNETLVTRHGFYGQSYFDGDLSIELANKNPTVTLEPGSRYSKHQLLRILPSVSDTVSKTGRIRRGSRARLLLESEYRSKQMNIYLDRKSLYQLQQTVTGLYEKKQNGLQLVQD